jgi:phenylacetate-CoA ligase
MTNLAAERAEQQRWIHRLRWPSPAYNALLEREFEDAERCHARTMRKLSAILGFSAVNVPHYRRLFKEIGADPNAPELLSVLPSLPILRKLDLRDNEAAFRAERLPEGERVESDAKSTGTTGMPVRVRHTARSMWMFSLLKQREYRWFRFDPGGTLAMIRPPRTLVRRPDGSEISDGESFQLSTWPNVGGDFSTGPAFAFSILNPPEIQIAWLHQIRPDHVLILSATLEHLAFVAGEQRPCESLKSVLAISEQLTPDMRTHVERSFGVPIHQNYGLNEIGIVAARCESGRYHVHSEHCLVEIIGADGRAARPGKTGRIVVTGLSNLAMPLIRYDADDLAIAVEGPCACGRTLPSFGEIIGRYSRFAFLPERSFTMLEAVRATILKMPPAQIHDLRQFQLHQFRDGRFELRLLARAPLPDTFAEQVNAAWAKAVRSSEQVLSLRYVDSIERAPGGKYQVFTSDFVPPADQAQGDARTQSTGQSPSP